MTGARSPKAPPHRPAPSHHARCGGGRCIRLRGEGIEDRGSLADHLPAIPGCRIGFETHLDLLAKSQVDVPADVGCRELDRRSSATTGQQQFADEEEDGPRCHVVSHARLHRRAVSGHAARRLTIDSIPALERAWRGRLLTSGAAASGSCSTHSHGRRTVERPRTIHADAWPAS